MQSSADIYLLYRVAELVRRYGLRPSVAAADFSWKPHPSDNGDGFYELAFHSRPDAPGTEEGDKFDKMMSTLGCKDGVLRSEFRQVIEDDLERALLMAPRARSVN